MKKLQAECEQLRKDYEEACKYLMEQAAKIKDPANDFVVSTFASGKVRTSLFDLRNIDYKNFLTKDYSLALSHFANYISVFTVFL